ncbi:serine/threonine protein kinase, partial [Streptomyces sp. 8P21H-1]|nr:serine/threonine protein kinase [Streptomyces sp. 8P21H-1]
HGHPARQQPPAWPTPPYGPGTGPGTGTVPDTEQPRRGTRSTALLVAVALVVALTAGASVYALVKGDDTRADTGPTENPATGAPVTPGPSTRAPSTRPSGAPEETPAEGAVPAEYLGTWTASIDNDTGRNTRRLTVRQGGVGDTVLSLTADGPAGSGTYHCVFRAALAEDPGAGDPLRIGPSEVTAGEPATSCSPGGATELTVLPDGRLRRVNTTSGEELTYTKQ